MTTGWWARLMAPEPFAPPRLGAWSLSWRWLLAAGWYALVMLAYLLAQTDPEVGPNLPPGWAIIVDLLLGLLALGLVALRRRWPLPVALATGLITIVSTSGLVAASWAFVSLAAHRRRLPILLGAAANIVAGLLRRVFPWNNDPAVPAGPLWLELAVGIGVGALMAALLALLGAAVGVRHDRQAALLAAAAAAERARENAVWDERNRIAREMHDVLAHRISLVALHAGALAYRDDLSPEQTRQIAGIIQENAQASLSELRSVLSSLREDVGVEPPQPTLGSLPDLLDQARQGGQLVELVDLCSSDQLAPVVSRHAYRIVQECLTNARKHAAGQPVLLTVSGGPSVGLTIRSANPLGPGVSLPGAGLGLVGIGERATLLGGRVTAGPQNNTFVVEVWLPWTT